MQLLSAEELLNDARDKIKEMSKRYHLQIGQPQPESKYPSEPKIF